MFAHVPDPCFPEYGKVELLLSDSPEKIRGRFTLTKHDFLFFVDFLKMISLHKQRAPDNMTTVNWIPNQRINMQVKMCFRCFIDFAKL